MTAAEYRKSLKLLGLSQVQAAYFLGFTIRTSHAWCHGRRIPLVVEKLLRLMIKTGVAPDQV